MRQNWGVITRLLEYPIVRFLIVGGINTVLTYAIFVGLGLVIPPPIAYSIAFALGLLWVVFGSSRIVFRSTGGGRRLAAFAAWYLFVYAAGQLVVQLFNPQGVTALLLTSLVVIVITTPLSFLGGRFIFRAQRTDPGDAGTEGTRP